MDNEEIRYRFECDCNGEIPIGDGPTLSETKKALADYRRDANRSPAKVLAELAAELMQSGEVYGPKERTMEHKARQYGGQIHCHVCGKQWEVNDPDPPECITEEEKRRQKGRQQMEKLRRQLRHR